ncbi:MAG: hypothetical protein ACRCU3_01005 [Eubacteriaceae bacterium]
MLYHLGTESNKVLLFIDIIGFSELIKSSDGFNAKDGQPHGISLMMPSFYELITNTSYSKENQEMRNIKFLWASDTIVISTVISNIDILLEELINLQNQFYCVSMAFRGVITIGNLYHEDNIWGEALVRAAEIEKTKVEFPCVIISKAEYSQLSISPRYKDYFLEDERNGDYLTFSVFKPNIDNIPKKNSSILHSRVHEYTKLVLENFEKAPEKMKYRWQWMAKELVSVIDSEYKKIDCHFKKAEELGRQNCDLEKIKNTLIDIL